MLYFSLDPFWLLSGLVAIATHHNVSHAHDLRRSDDRAFSEQKAF